MKVLLLNQSFAPDTTATAQHLVDLALLLIEQGHEVTVVADERDYETRRVRYPRRSKWQGVCVVRVPSTAFGKRSFVHRALDALVLQCGYLGSLFGLPRQDLVVSFTSPPLVGLWGAIYCRARGARNIQWLMDLNVDAAIALGMLRETSLLARLLLAVQRRVLRGADLVVVEDRYTADRAVQRGAARERTVIVPPWPAQEWAPQSAPAPRRPNRLRDRLELGDRFVVMYSGNHAAAHPLDTLLGAAVACQDDPALVFLFVGGGVRVSQVRDAIARHRLKNIVQLPLQPRDELAETLAAADLHVVVMANAMNGLGHPSKVYGILAAGRPWLLIGPRESCVGDLATQCPGGYQVEQGDVAGALGAIRSAQSLTGRERLDNFQAQQHLLHSCFGRQRSLTRFLDAAIPPESRARLRK